MMFHSEYRIHPLVARAPVGALPVHSGEEIRPALLTKILRDCDMTKEEFKELL